ncbi:hypothetical protein SOASR029_21940 [Budvicia aquatica]|nr:hypothetical protein SOASR029_21940 [Budvicia aquatica]
MTWYVNTIQPFCNLPSKDKTINRDWSASHQKREYRYGSPLDINPNNIAGTVTKETRGTARRLPNKAVQLNP